MDSLPALPHLARHALSVAVALARLPPGERLSSAALAEQTGAPQPILAKVLRELGRCGIVDGLKGHHGGYRLARAPASIPLAEVLGCRDGQASRLPVHCLLAAGPCQDRDPCPLHGRWVEALGPIRRMFVESTLADLAA